MANNVVKGDATRESNTTLDLLGLLTIVNFVEFFFHVLVNGLANSVDISVSLAKGHSLFHCT